MSTNELHQIAELGAGLAMLVLGGLCLKGVIGDGFPVFGCSRNDRDGTPDFGVLLHEGYDVL